MKDDSSNHKDSSKENKAERSTPVTRTLFGDVIPSPKPKKKSIDKWKTKDPDTNSKKRPHSPQNQTQTDAGTSNRGYCSSCDSKPDELCKKCNLLPQSKPLNNVEKKIKKVSKPKKEWYKLFEDVSFSLSGYVNPQRDEIRRKALKMGAKYIADPNITNNKCTHLICAFKNTPKSQQLKGHCKIVGHKFIEDCYNKKKR